MREETLALLMASELVTPGGPSAVCDPPGTTQYLLSLARLALSASVESPLLWGMEEDGNTSRGPLLLGCLLQCPHYEVRELALGEVLKRLERERDEEKGEGERSSHWPQETIISNLTTLALHEAHPQSLAKVRHHGEGH